MYHLRAGKLATVLARLLHIERVLYGLLEGAWPDGEWRVAWLSKVRHAASAADVAPRLLELEAALRPGAMRAEWRKAPLAGGCTSCIQP